MKSLRPLTILLEVARTGSVRHAAAALDVSQPAVSAAIAELGRTIGAELLVRDGRGVRLTDAGKKFVEYGRRAMALLAEGQDAAAAIAGTASRLRIAAVTTAAESFVPGLLGGFLAKNAMVSIDLDVSNRERIWDRLNHNEVELVVAGEPPVSPQCRTLGVRANDLVIVSHPAVSLTQQDLAEATWLMREAGSGTRARTQEVFAALGFVPKTLTIGSNGAIRECVRAGLGVSVLSTDAVGDEIAAGRLRIVPSPATPRRRFWRLVTNAERVLTKSARAFVTFALASGVFVGDELPS